MLGRHSMWLVRNDSIGYSIWFFFQSRSRPTCSSYWSFNERIDQEKSMQAFSNKSWWKYAFKCCSTWNSFLLTIFRSVLSIKWWVKRCISVCWTTKIEWYSYRCTCELCYRSQLGSGATLRRDSFYSWSFWSDLAADQILPAKEARASIENVWNFDRRVVRGQPSCTADWVRFRRGFELKELLSKFSSY